MAYKYSFKDTDYVLIDSAKLNKTIEKKGENQTSLGAKTGWSHSTISHNLTRGRMSYELLKKLCKAMNVKPATYIINSKPVNNKYGTNSAKKATSGRYPWGGDPKKLSEKNKEEIKKMEEELNKKLAKAVVNDPENNRTVKGIATTEVIKKLPIIEPDKPLVVNLKVKKSEIEELIDVQKEIRDVLRELVEALK